MPSQLRRVLILGLNYPPERTGISPYTGAMAGGIASRSYETRALTAHPHYPDWAVKTGYGQWVRRENIDGVHVSRLLHYVPSRPSGMRRALSELTFGLRQAGQRWERPSVIVAVSPALISTAVSRLRSLITHPKTPFVVWVQDLYSLGLSETSQSGGIVLRTMQALEGWVLRRATRVIVIHDRFAKRVHHDFAVPMDRIEVIRNWTHLSRAPEVDRDLARVALRWGTDEVIVLHAGNMGVKQGLGNVVEAGRLAQVGGHRVRFVFLGGGSERAHLEELARDVDTVTFLEALSESEFGAALQAADVLLVNEKPGVAEMAVPSKLTSYFAAGRPVLAATDLAGITAEEIRHSGGGAVVPAGDPQALLDGVLALCADRSHASELGASGRRFRDTVLDETTAIDAFDALLSGLIDGDEPLDHFPKQTPEASSRPMNTETR
ncbi:MULTISPECIES: glycosyltransferase [unclassified Microbacterium]|uniref:glycosyltransferase n=1 Tax=unclassified Microbacterium TaxID=2609290 RepID=UPI00214CACFC|nr:MULTISPECIES: glycosyltransferase [unclassified Microbacterium]MCR2784954.1 glycosyltransferase [Microbacterium sp. zg.B96]WIM16493.1 glycosyltransferase [Microbacterium sp. zg-B96]